MLSPVDQARESAVRKSPARRPVRRRRWAAAALVLALATWWNWPRGDTRFVGVWQLHRAGRAQPSFVFQLNRNGGGWATHLLNNRVTGLKWRVDQDTLTLGYGTPGASPGPVFRLQQWLQENVGWHPWIIWAENWRIVAVGQNEIRIQPANDSEIMTLRRVHAPGEP